MSEQEKASRVGTAEIWVSYVLRAGVIISLVMVLIGTVLTFMHHREYFTASSSLQQLTGEHAQFPRDLRAIAASTFTGQGRGWVLAGLFVLIFISRGRAYADKKQAIALVSGAAAAVCVGVIKYVLHEPAASGQAVLWATMVLAGFGLAGLAAALLVPITRFTPLARMIAEWLELMAIIAALPLAAWIGGLFTWVRMR